MDKTRQHLFKEVFSCRYHLQETKQLHVEDFFLMAAAYWSLGLQGSLVSSWPGLWFLVGHERNFLAMHNLPGATQTSLANEKKGEEAVVGQGHV